MINIQDNIAEISVGNISIGSAYVGNQLVWEKSAPVLPYDAQVEWLGSSGSQYIQLPLNAPANTFFGVEFDVLIDTVYANTNNIIFGGTPWRQCNVSYYTSSATSITFSSYLGNSTRNGGMGILIGIKNHVIFSTSQTHTYTENGNVTNISVSRPLSGAMSAFRIFGGYRYANRYPCKVYNFKITVGDSLVYNLIPVRKDGVGYMYDKISGELYGNVGTGSFTYGDDVV